MPTMGWSQTSDPLQQVEKRLADKQAAAEAHRKQMEGIKDLNQLTTAMRQHFQMTEEIGVGPAFVQKITGGDGHPPRRERRGFHLRHSVAH